MELELEPIGDMEVPVCPDCGVTLLAKTTIARCKIMPNTWKVPLYCGVCGREFMVTMETSEIPSISPCTPLRALI